MNSLSGCSEKIDGDWHDMEKLELSYFSGGKVKCRTFGLAVFSKHYNYYTDQNLTPYDYAQVK